MASGARSSHRTFAGILASFTAYCERFGLPAMKVPKPRAQQRPHRFLTQDELQRLWLACPDDTYRLMFLLLLEGLRASEATGIRWSDVEGDSIRVLGKGGRYRRIAVSRPLGAILGELASKDGYVLGFGYDELRRRVLRLGRLARIPRLHAHLLRHTFASQALIAGMDSETLRTLGGWSPTSVAFQRYIQSAKESAALARSREFALTDRLLS
jgi:integrase